MCILTYIRLNFSTMHLKIDLEHIYHLLHLLTTLEHSGALFLEGSKWKCVVCLTQKLAALVVVTRQLISFQPPFVLQRRALAIERNEVRLVVNLSSLHCIQITAVLVPQLII